MRYGRGVPSLPGGEQYTARCSQTPSSHKSSRSANACTFPCRKQNKLSNKPLAEEGTRRRRKKDEGAEKGTKHQAARLPIFSVHFAHYSSPILFSLLPLTLTTIHLNPLYPFRHQAKNGSPQPQVSQSTTTMLSAANERPTLTLALAWPIRQVRGPQALLLGPSHAFHPQKQPPFLSRHGLQESRKRKHRARGDGFRYRGAKGSVQIVFC